MSSYALVNTQTMDLTTGAWQGSGQTATYVFTTSPAVPGTVMNLIVYDGKADYTPATNLVVVEVPSTAKIGDTGYLPS